MSSILTNTSAMVALETLRNINGDLAKVNNEISTGMKVASAKDNAAFWAISTVMSTDVQSFEQISESLSVGSSTVEVARSASEEITELLQDMKELIVSAQGKEGTEDAERIQTDIEALTAQVDSIVEAAQFNGVNLINGAGSMSILSSLDRGADQSVTASFITVSNIDLSTGDAVAGTVIADGEPGHIDVGTASVDTGDTSAISFDDDANLVEGDIYTVDVGGVEVSYTLGANETIDDVVASLVADINDEGTHSAVDNGDGTFTITSGADGVTISASTETGAVAAGGLNGLSDIDVTTDSATALEDIEAMLTTAIDAAASFGSAQNRIEIQSDFVSTLIDSLNTGIGAIRDADMEAASAKLTALQTQQQLATQSLSIANTGPQNLLSLFQ